MKNKTFYMLSPGSCSRRAIESEKIINYLKLNGYLPAKDISQAELIFISTCAFDKDMEDIGIKVIEKVLETKCAGCTIIVGGCLPKINNKRLLKLGKFETVSPRNNDKLDGIINAKIKFKSVKDPNILKKPKKRHMYCIDLFKKFKYRIDLPSSLWKKIYYIPPLLHSEDEVYFIKVGDGCVGNCSYCAIKYSMGRLKSKPIKTIIEEFERGLERGYILFKLTAEDIGSYGVDTNTTIIELLKKIFSLDGRYSVIIHNFNPNFLVKYQDELLEIIENYHEKIKHIDIPIQSGSDTILKVMKRPYKIKQVEKCLLNLKESVKDIRFTTQIMVGFPGETKKDFERTMELIKKIGFYKVTISKYSDRPRTESNSMKNKVPEIIKTWRAFRLWLFCRIRV